MTARALTVAVALAASASLAEPPKRPPSRLDASPHNFYDPAHRPAGMDACQYCHPPNTLRTTKSQRPLWDPAARGRSAALDQRADPAGPPLALRWAGSTLRCLSCHDATVSSINVVYRPQSSSLRDDPAAGDGQRAGGMRSVTLVEATEWNSKVMENHPVSVPYPLQLDAAEYKGFLPRAVPPNGAEWEPDPRKAGLKLYSDKSGFDLLTGSAGVECASCHDPHGTPNPYFLRLPKERSQLCLGCHRK